MDELKRYAKCRPKMGTGDLLLWAGTGPISWLIKKFSCGDVNHASMILRIDQYMKDRVMQMGAVGRGFYPTPLSKELANYSGSVYWLPLHHKFDSRRIEMGYEALKLSGVAYDYGSLFRNILGHVNMGIKRLFCSEIYQMVGYKAGLPVLTGYESKALRPCELELLGWVGNRHKLV